MDQDLEASVATTAGEFRDFVIGSQHRLVHFAELLTGDRGQAEDLVQEGYVAAYAAWSRVAAGSPEAYVRRCVINRRTSWWRRPVSRETVADPAAELGIAIGTVKSTSSRAIGKLRADQHLIEGAQQ